MTDPLPGVDADDLLVLARVAGLPIEDDRAAGLARELTSTLIAVRELDALLADQPALAARAFSPYDPAWSDESTPGTGAGR